MKKQLFFYLVIASLLPTGSIALGAPTETANPADKVRDLKIDDLKAARISVVMKDATPENDNHATTVMLTGSIEEDCLKHVQITNSQVDSTLQAEGIAFRIRDVDGEGLSCLKKGCRGASCLHLSVDVPNAKMDLTNAGDGEVKLIIVNEGDPNSPNHVEREPLSKLSGDLPPHRSKKTIEKAEREAEEKRQQEVLEYHHNVMSTCKKSLGGLPISRKAARAIFNIDKDSSSYKSVLQEFDTIEIQLMAASAKTIPLSNLEDLRQELLNWRTSHSESAEIVAGALKTLAARLVNQKDKSKKSIVTLDDYRVARDILLEAQDDPYLSDKTINELQKDIDSNDTGYLAAFGMAAATNQDPFAIDSFNNEFRGIVERLTDRLRDSCYGVDRRMEACSMASNAYRNVMSIPATVQKIQQEKWQNEQKINQQLAQLTGGQPGQGQMQPFQAPQYQMPMTSGQQGSWGPVQQNPMYSGMPNSMYGGGMMNSGGYWSGGTYGRQTF